MTLESLLLLRRFVQAKERATENEAKIMKDVRAPCHLLFACCHLQPGTLWGAHYAPLHA